MDLYRRPCNGRFLLSKNMPFLASGVARVRNRKAWEDADRDSFRGSLIDGHLPSGIRTRAGRAEQNASRSPARGT